MPRDDSSPDSETPWTEDQWEAFLKEGELRAARYGELLESLMDHPDRDAIIDREMGWNRRHADADEDEQDDELPLLEDASEDDDEEDEYDNEEDDAEDDNASESQPWLSMEEEHAEADEDLSIEAEEAALSTIDAYARSKAIAVRIHEALKPALESQDQHIDEEFAEAFINSQIACVKVASGHGMGYEDDVLCGNIVCCKTALSANTRAAEALTHLRDKNLAAPAIIDPLIQELADARRSIERRISDLRSRVWWDRMQPG